MNKPLTTTVRACARCEGYHENLTFQPLTNPSEEWSHWAMCPEANEPIMLSFSIDLANKPRIELLLTDDVMRLLDSPAVEALKTIQKQHDPTFLEIVVIEKLTVPKPAENIPSNTTRIIIDSHKESEETPEPLIPSWRGDHFCQLSVAESAHAPHVAYWLQHLLHVIQKDDEWHLKAFKLVGPCEAVPALVMTAEEREDVTNPLLERGIREDDRVLYMARTFPYYKESEGSLFALGDTPRFKDGYALCQMRVEQGPMLQVDILNSRGQILRDISFRQTVSSLMKEISAASHTARIYKLMPFTQKKDEKH